MNENNDMAEEHHFVFLLSLKQRAKSTDKKKKAEKASVLESPNLLRTKRKGWIEWNGVITSYVFAIFAC